MTQDEPHQAGHGKCQQGAENRPPARYHQNHLPEAGRDSGHNDKHREHERHDPGHLAALVSVADERQRDDSGTRRANALQEAAREHGRVTPGSHGQQATEHEQPQADVHSRLSTEAVGERPIQELSQPKPQEQRGNHQLAGVFPLHAELAADLSQGGQHGVDRQRRRGHQHGHQQRKFAGRQCLDGAHGAGLQMAERSSKSTPKPALAQPIQVGIASSPNQRTPETVSALPAITA